MRHPLSRPMRRSEPGSRLKRETGPETTKARLTHRSAGTATSGNHRLRKSPERKYRSDHVGMLREPKQWPGLARSPEQICIVASRKKHPLLKGLPAHVKIVKGRRSVASTASCTPYNQFNPLRMTLMCRGHAHGCSWPAKRCCGQPARARLPPGTPRPRRARMLEEQRPGADAGIGTGGLSRRLRPAAYSAAAGHCRIPQVISTRESTVVVQPPPGSLQVTQRSCSCRVCAAERDAKHPAASAREAAQTP